MFKLDHSSQPTSISKENKNNSGRNCKIYSLDFYEIWYDLHLDLPKFLRKQNNARKYLKLITLHKF